MAKLNQFSVLLQKRFFVLVVVSLFFFFVTGGGEIIQIKTAVSRLEKSPSDIKTIITMSKNKYQLSSNILDLFDFLPQYVAKCAKVTKTSS